MEGAQLPPQKNVKLYFYVHRHIVHMVLSRTVWNCYFLSHWLNVSMFMEFNLKWHQFWKYMFITRCREGDWKKIQQIYKVIHSGWRAIDNLKYFFFTCVFFSKFLSLRFYLKLGQNKLPTKPIIGSNCKALLETK